MFVNIVKGHYAGWNMARDIVRVNAKTIGVSENISELFQRERYTMGTGREGLKLGIAVDVEAKQIKLYPDSKGFSFYTSPNGRTLSLVQPSQFRKMNVPKSDYLLSGTNGRELIFAQVE